MTTLRHVSADDTPAPAYLPDRGPLAPLSSVGYHVAILLAAIVIFAGARILQLDAAGRLQGPWPGATPWPTFCTTKLLLGVSCPGCGASRAAVRLAHGDFAGAWAANRAAFILLLGLAAQIPYRLFCLAARRELNISYGLLAVLLWGAVFLLAGNWIWNYTAGSLPS